MRARQAWVVFVAGLAALFGPRAAADLPPRARLQALATAWRAGDARAVAAHCTRAGRVQFELRGAQGSYGAAQLEMVLERLFEGRETLAFAFQDDGLAAGAATAFARAEWLQRVRAEGGERRETLTFALRLEGGEWRIVEIRASP